MCHVMSNKTRYGRLNPSVVRDKRIEADKHACISGYRFGKAVEWSGLQSNIQPDDLIMNPLINYFAELNEQSVPSNRSVLRGDFGNSKRGDGIQISRHLR